MLMVLIPGKPAKHFHKYADIEIQGEPCVGVPKYYNFWKNYTRFMDRQGCHHVLFKLLDRFELHQGDCLHAFFRR